MADIKCGYFSFGLIISYPVLDIVNRAKKVIKTVSAEGNYAPEYSVNTFSYGSGKDIRRKEFSSDARLLTRSFDASELLPNWGGFSGWYRTHYWGFDSRSLPLNARVWMPLGEGPFPLVLITHGDHAMQDYSDAGYEYIAKPLAEKGYIVSLLDNNFLNRSWSDLMLTQSLTGSGEIQTRAQLMVEHLKAWSDWNLRLDTPVSKKVDLNRVAVIGHSRGGEAVAHVSHLLKASGYEGIDVKSVIAIAPVDNNYFPNRKRNTLKQINFMVLHGSMDIEVRFDGRGQYSRTDVSALGEQTFTKVAIYSEGSNHGQFNSTWGPCDNEFFSPLCTRLNLKGLMPEVLQQEFARFTISSFLNLTIKGDEASRKNIRDKKELSGRTLSTRYKVQYQDSNSIILRDFQGANASDDIVLKNMTSSSISRLAGGARAHRLRWRDCTGMRAGKDCWAEYDLSSRNDRSYSKIRFDLANTSDAELDFTVKFRFVDGSEMTTSLERHGLLGGGFARSLKKSSYILNRRSSEIVFDSYFIDLGKRSALKSLTFVFDKHTSGEVYVDNIGLL